jgi:signal transduction histidine kinase
MESAIPQRPARSRDHLVLFIAGALFVVIVVIESLAPANVVGAYGFVVPILLVATVRKRKLMVFTLLACVLATYVGLLRPTKPGRFVSAVINRTVVAGVLVAVAYFAMTREERKAREEEARAALAAQTETLLQANMQLEKLKDALNRSVRLAAAGQLAAEVAHEVGTPLHSIAWHVQSLAEEPQLTMDMKRRLHIIDQEINRVVKNVKNLLSLTRQRKPSRSPLAVEELVQSVAALMEPSFRRKGIQFRVHVGAEASTVWGDVEQLQQVLMNLLTNALAATSSGQEVQIIAAQRPVSSEEAEARRRTGERPIETMVTLIVQDTGSGMPEEHLRRAFEPFFTTKASGDGTGLGLYLSREIVTAHGGTLDIQSEVGKGTTVRVTLPNYVAVPTPVSAEAAHER